MKRVALPIMVGKDRVFVSEYISGDKTLSFVSRQGVDGKIREMVLSTNFSKLANWHHLTPQPSLWEHFPELDERELNFLESGSIYDITKNNHERPDGYAVNYDK